MRDLLVPIFGDWGAVVAQYLLTVVIVLGLIGAVWWFMRRYSGVHFGGIGRGRVPRLAIVDAMPIDRRRRLILVRRDNVEHLLLIGGPSDVVVEGTIQRVRQRSVQAAAQAAVARATLQPAVETPAEPEPPQPETAGTDERPANEPIPFPLSRGAHAAGGIRQRPVPARFRAATAGPSARVSRHAGTGRQPRRPPLSSRSARPDCSRCMPRRRHRRLSRRAGGSGARGASPRGHDGGGRALAAGASRRLAAPATFAEAEWEAAEAARQSALDLGDVATCPRPHPARRRWLPADTAGEEEMAPATAPGQDETAPADPTARVGDLEREMARLLDEITTRRSS